MVRTNILVSLLAMGAVGTTAVVAAPADQGKQVYETACITCHGANGKGTLPGVPDLTTKGGVLSKPDAVLLKHTTEGFQSPGSPMPMPPKGGNPSLTEAQIRAAIGYMRKTFHSQ